MKPQVRVATMPNGNIEAAINWFSVHYIRAEFHHRTGAVVATHRCEPYDDNWRYLVAAARPYIAQ